MNSDVLARLIDAANTGETVSIVYHRGSQPGTVREIALIPITDEEVRARDLAAGVDKNFKLAYLELAEPWTAARAYDPAAPVEDTQILEAALEPHVEELRALRWHVERTETCASVHRYLKSGRPRRDADVAIMFNELTISACDDGTG
jgi:hypothetical protein